MTAPIQTVRSRLAMAEEQLQIACKCLRDNGLPENADALAVELKRLRVWTQADGWLDHLERQP